jgi:Ca2+-binding EF-hand superfamily protein
MNTTGTSMLTRKNSAMIAGELAKSLVDDMMMSRYGTSLEIGMTREYQKYIDQKYQVLKAEFNAIDKDTDDNITIDELTEFFQKYTDQTGKEYTKDYIEKVFKLIDKDKDQHITV